MRYVRPPAATLAVLALLLAAVVAPSIAHAQLAGQAPVIVNVTSVTLKLKVYSDGAVQPIYTLHATIAPTQTPTPPTPSKPEAGGSIDIQYVNRLEESKSHTSFIAKGSLKGGESEEPVKIYAKLSVDLVRGNGSFSLVLRGYEADNKFNITLPSAKVQTRGSTVWVTGYLYISPVEPEEVEREELPSPSEINAALAQQGLDYLRILSLNRTMVGSDTVRLGFTVAIDLKKLARKLSTQMEPEKAKRLEELLSNPQQLERVKVEVEASVWSVGDLLEFSVNYESYAEGNITAYQEYVRELGKLLSTVQSQQLPSLPVGTATPKELMLLLTLQKLLQNPASTSLVQVPPSESRLELHIEIGGEGASIGVAYTGHRLAVPGVAEPEERAEKTLTALALAIHYYRQNLAALAQFIGGIDKLVPEKVQLEPVGEVELSKTSVPVGERAAGEVKVKPGKTETTKTTTTKTATGPKTTTTRTGAGGTVETGTTTAAKTSETGAETAEGKGVSTATIALAVSAGMLVAAIALLVLVIRRR